MTANLLAALETVFPGARHFGPSMTMRFDVDAGQMDAPELSDEDIERLMGKKWGEAGREIEYKTLQPPQPSAAGSR